MTLLSKLPLSLNQKITLFKNHIDSLFIKLEVITNSNAIVNSVRIMIVILALLMGYIHTPRDKKKLTQTSGIEKFTEYNNAGFTNLNQ